MKDYSQIPTFSEFSEFIDRMNFDLDAESLYKEFSDRGWTTKKGKPMISWTALIVSRNGVVLARRTKNAIKGFPSQYRDRKRLSKSVRRELAESRRQDALQVTENVKRTYRQELTHPYWYAFRNFVLMVKGHKCEVCGRTDGTMNIHHIAYTVGRHAWEYSVKDVKVLCPTCHKRAHGIL